MSIETIDRIADVTAGSDSLPVLAARIRHYHAATAESLRCSVENAMCAGDALLEAKIAVPHGQWLPWLAEHCKLSERSAQLYMQIARNREAIEAKFTDGVEDLTLNQAAGLMMLTADVKEALEWARKLQMINDPEKVVALCIEANDVASDCGGCDIDDPILAMHRRISINLDKRAERIRQKMARRAKREGSR